MFKNIFLILAIIFTLFSCQKDNNLGEVLLQNEKIELSYKNNFEIKAGTYKGEDPIGFNLFVDIFNQVSLTTPSIALIGDVQDPIFGSINSSFYARLVYNPNTGVPTFKGLLLDSAVLVFAYDTLGFYGNNTGVHNLTVEEISEDYKDIDTVFSTKDLMTTGNVIGSKSFVPNFKDSITILAHTDTSSLNIPAQLRIRMNQQWAESFIKNPLVETAPSDDINNVLYSAMKGLKISSSSDGKGIIGLGVDDIDIGSGGLTKMFFYFTDTANVKSNYTFYFSRQKFNSFDLDYTGSLVETFIGDEAKGDSLVFVQSMNGLNFYVDLKDFVTIKDKLINFAELEFTVATLPGDNLSTYNPVLQLLALENSNGEKIEIDDVALLQELGLPVASSFGGYLDNETTPITYRLNISRYIKKLQKETNPDTKIFIRPDIRINQATRSVIYGPKHSTYPIKLKVIMTEK